MRALLAAAHAQRGVCGPRRTYSVTEKKKEKKKKKRSNFVVQVCSLMLLVLATTFGL